MAQRSSTSSLVNGKPDALTKLDGFQQDGTPLSVAANSFEGNITQANQTSQINIGALLVLSSKDQDPEVIARILALGNELIANSKTAAPPISEAKPFKNNSSAPALSPEDREILESARQEQLTEMREKRKSILIGFMALLEKCDDATADFEDLPDLVEAIEAVKEDIEEQNFRFELTSESLIKAVQSSSLEETELSVLLQTEVSSKMESISQAVEAAPYYLEIIFNNFRDKDNPELDEHTRRRAMQPQSEARDVLANIGRCLNQFDELAQPLIGKDLNTDPNTHKDPSYVFWLSEFSCASTATATLFQCFCKACPRHHRHTAYLSLDSSNSAAPGTRMAILSSGPKAKDPVWLKVVSESMAPQVPSPERADDMKVTIETGKHNLKRRRSSDGLAPPSKLRKTVAGSLGTPGHEGQDEIDISRRNPIQFCPEYLAQHEEVEYPVMQMVDASSAIHRFYFLPADQRPPANCEPVSLHKMLLTGNTKVLWKVQVARLIAEAALRFDWPEIRCQWGRDDIVFYYLRAPFTDILGPFLKVEIEKGPHTTNTKSGEQPTSGGGQTRRLLNLAFTLLQVGLFKPIEPPLEPCDDSMYGQYIVNKISSSTDDTQITGDYNTVVRQCTKLADEARTDDIGRGHFRKRYYQYIISPLKEMESNLLGLQGKRGEYR